MQIIIAFTIGAVLGLIFSPKKFTLSITTKDKTDNRPDMPMLTEEDIERLIGPESTKQSNLSEINDADIHKSIAQVVDEIFRGDSIYDNEE